MSPLDTFCDNLAKERGWIAADVIRDRPTGNILTVVLKFDGSRFIKALDYGKLGTELRGFSLTASNESHRTVMYDYSKKSVMHGLSKLEVNTYPEAFSEENLVQILNTVVDILQKVVDNEDEGGLTRQPL